MSSNSVKRASARSFIAVSCALLAGVVVVDARVAPRQTTTPVALNPPDFQGWGYMGCYSDSTASRTLAIAAHFGEHVDDDNCVYQCIQLGHIFAGVEYGGQCYCGDYVNPIATQEPESDCYMPCTKTPTEACGGPNRINLYYLEGATAVTPPATVTTNPGVDGWVSEGCYSDLVGARTLANQVAVVGPMTVKLCVDACQAAGYSLAGVEYGGQCFCDNVYTNGAPYSSLSNCNMACTGNLTEYCGGPGALNLYSYQGATPTVSIIPSSTVTPVTNIPLPSAWATMGCYTDNVASRALTHELTIPSLTVEKCISACAAKGYTIAGVEYGGECYCDSVVSNNQGLAADGNAGCNMPCSGNAGETCGGPSRINVYAAGPAWVQLGCYSDQVYSRTLTTLGAYSGLLTVEKCLASCGAAGFAYAGMEYSSECHCGNTFSNGGGPASDGNVGCSWTCAGNTTELCGGNSRLSMYEYINAAGVVAPATTISPSSSPTATSIVSTPFPTTSIPHWSYAGCYVDGVAGRILATQQPDSATNTVESCIATCAGLGMSIAGLEYSTQCFCSNYIYNGGVLSSSNSNCAMTCSGNSAEICGGPGLLSVYSTSPPAIAVIPTVQKTGLPTTWAYSGCYADSIAMRDTGATGTEIDSSVSMTATYCLTRCQLLGYDAAGTEYSTQCFCGTSATFAAVAPALLADSACNMACSGNSSQLCGGAGAISFYLL